jgi:hypothetical protein
VENKLMRVDHCHFNRLYQGRCIWANDHCWGVADHNVFKGRSGLGTTQTFFIQHSNFGNETWADYPWYGTDKFFFIEDNTVDGFINLTDSDTGGKFVVRHNYVINATVTDHGTEGGAIRGVRCKEVYDNTFYLSKPSHPGGQRSGTCLWHDNTVIGPSAPNPSGVICSFQNYRASYTRAHPGWGIADGTSVWDANDTEGNGTFVEGHAPHLFDSGSASSSAAEGTLIDASKKWTTNQWKFYSIKHTNPASASYGLGSYIISNTATTITFANSGGAQGHLIFNAGDTYKIHRVLVMMDQNGRGKTDLIIGGATPINTTTRTASYAHSVLEPCYSWNNVYAPTRKVLGLRARPDQPTTKEGIDYANLGNGFPAGTTPAQVSATYTAARNGVDYVGTFVYPHPLTLLPVGTPRAVVSDFGGGSSPDYVLQRANSHETAIWYLNNNVLLDGDLGPTLPPSWALVGAADFNGDRKPDYLLYNGNTQQTAVFYLSGVTLLGWDFGPTLPPGWALVGAADFNGDGKPDYLLYQWNTQQTAIFYLSGVTLLGWDFGSTLPPGWSFFGP